MKNKSNIAKVALTVGLLVGTGAAAFGVANAATSTSSQGKAAKILKKKAAKKSTATSGATASAQAVTGSTVPAVPQSIDGDADGMRHRGGPINLDNVAKVLGITTTELQTELRTKSFATIAKEKSVELQKVKDQLLKDFTDKEQAEVAAGEHTQAEVDAKITQFTANLDTMVNTVRPAPGPGMGRGGHGAPFVTDALAKTLGLTTTELQTQVQSGKTLAAIAKEQNVDIQKVKDTLTADFKAHLDTEVAAGEHTQAEADAKLADFKTRVDDLMNGVRPAGGPGMDGHGHLGGRGGHGHGMGDANGMPGMPGSTQSSVQGASFNA